MSERLSDAELDDALDMLNSDHVRPGAYDIRLMIAELRERRAADIPTADIESIVLAMAVVKDVQERVTDNEFDARLAIVLDALGRIAKNAYEQTPLYLAALDKLGGGR